MTDENFGPGSLATMLGSEPQFEEDTVWYLPIWDQEAAPDSLTGYRVDTGNRWFLKARGSDAGKSLAGGGGLCGGDAGFDRGVGYTGQPRAGTNELLEDLIERPGWVSEKVMEINQAWLVAYGACRAICRTAEDWAFTGAFRWPVRARPPSCNAISRR